MILEKRVKFLDLDKETKQGGLSRMDGRKRIINLQPDIIGRGGRPASGFETLVRKSSTVFKRNANFLRWLKIQSVTERKRRSRNSHRIIDAHVPFVKKFRRVDGGRRWHGAAKPSRGGGVMRYSWLNSCAGKR